MSIISGAPFLMTYGPVILAFLVGCLITISLSRKMAEEPPSVPAPVNTRKVYIQDSSTMEEFPLVEEENPPDTPEPTEQSHVPLLFSMYPEHVMLQRSKGFLEQMKMRRTVRTFSDRHVPLEIIENVISVAGTSPSGANQQPWTYVVVANPRVKTQVRHIIENEEKINYGKRMGHTWVKALELMKTNWEKPYLDEAPYLVVLFKHSYGVDPEGNRKVLYYNEISASISAGLLLTAIHNVGLVTVTSTPMNAGLKLRTLLNRPENEKVLLLLPVGYPATGCCVPPVTKKPLQELMKVI